MVAKETIVFKLSAHNRPSNDIDWMWEGKIIFFTLRRLWGSGYCLTLAMVETDLGCDCAVFLCLIEDGKNWRKDAVFVLSIIVFLSSSPNVEETQEEGYLLCSQRKLMVQRKVFLAVCKPATMRNSKQAKYLQGTFVQESILSSKLSVSTLNPHSSLTIIIIFIRISVLLSSFYREGNRGGKKSFKRNSHSYLHIVLYV